MRRRGVAVVVGTRPEAIKLGPVVVRLRESDWATVQVIGTGQHGEVVDESLALFNTPIDRRIRPARGTGELALLSAELIGGLCRAFAESEPELVVVQGDTLSAFAGAFAAYLAKIPVAHVEAGLRSHDRLPFPEEANRRLIAPLTDLHLAPTESARSNLLAERIPAARVIVTGNTVVDALLQVAPAAPAPGEGRPSVLITAHRRESWGEPLHGIARAVATLAEAYPETDFTVAGHMNGAVRSVFEAAVAGMPNARCTPPLPYPEFVRLLTRSTLVITDSGGVQEETTALGLPTLVMREVTERGEALTAGVAHLVGVDAELIVKSAMSVLDRMSGPGAELRVSPFGDGRAAGRVVQACGWLFGLQERPEDFAYHPAE
ncbi:non-hydrolyzing UDP-N-acetylglucosamine 2-epimerase [Rhizohabitans arisaemae]|uniref:non-hydrolyzing UDP-N-acetylglucosamine 2-epimerase n=1 Tax=Rhizohabitans arisaemae TaxID=2720610 RepID=UPI0024B1ED1C|nr:UDP-N-acetylglucosamine 2-epimerase (non-hydrolyzing) [Rhizohabitans arisaemae]